MVEPDELTEALWLELHGEHCGDWVVDDDGDVYCGRCRTVKERMDRLRAADDSTADRETASHE